MIYTITKKVEDKAYEVYDSLSKTAKGLGLGYEDAFFIEMKNESDLKELESRVVDFMDEKDRICHPSMAVCLLDDISNYPKYKKLLIQFGIPSQMILM